VMAKYSAVVIGSGPNGLAAAIVLAQAGLQIEVREAAAQIGGAARTEELTLPGFLHDPGSAVHPMALSSPFFRSLPLHQFGLEWIFSPAELAHPFDDGTAVTLERDLRDTAQQLGADGPSYARLFQPLIDHWPVLFAEVFRPLTIPRHPLLLSRFGIRAFQPCTLLMKSLFRGDRARSLISGSAAHSALDLRAPLSAAFGLIIGGAGHAVGWPVPKGGSQSISNALAGVLRSLGGRIVTNSRVHNIDELGSPDLILCDVTPCEFLKIAGHKLKTPFQKLLRHFKYGPGAFKVDWALREPIPWKAKECRRSLTVHLSGGLEEMAASEHATHHGRVTDKPFVLLAQPSLYDPSRAPAGRHTAWAYCHVPNGWSGSALTQIENQVERFAPGFRECVLARSVHSAAELEQWDSNLVGGDVNCGALSVNQFFSRPTWRRYGTPLSGVYLCSASTPPGGAVHGMCGYWAAKRALRYLAKRL
jgi:phytoene dehydrogenase-like protein